MPNGHLLGVMRVSCWMAKLTGTILSVRLTPSQEMTEPETTRTDRRYHIANQRSIYIRHKPSNYSITIIHARIE